MGKSKESSMDVTSICLAFVDLVAKVYEADLTTPNLTRGLIHTLQ